MRSLKPTLRDWCWLLVALVVAGVWWRELRLRKQFETYFGHTRGAVRELSEISGWTVVQREGRFFMTGRKSAFGRGTCPNCGRRVTVDGEYERHAVSGPGGETTYFWQQTGECPRCKIRLGCIIAPSDDPGYQQWLPLPEEERSEL